MGAFKSSSDESLTFANRNDRLHVVTGMHSLGHLTENPSKLIDGDDSVRPWVGTREVAKSVSQIEEDCNAQCWQCLSRLLCGPCSGIIRTAERDERNRKRL